MQEFFWEKKACVMDKYYYVEIKLILPLDGLNLFVVDDYFCSTFSLIGWEFAQAPPDIIKHVCKLTTWW